MLIQYQDFPVLYVDDERQNLLTFRYAMEDYFKVLTASGGADALEILEHEEVAILLADQRMPEMTGVELCTAARSLRPDVLRVIVTAYSDLASAVAAINQGQVLRYLTKPWNDEELRATLANCIELVQLQRTLRDMQMRLFRSGSPRMVEALGAEIAREMGPPVAALEITNEQVRDLLDTGLAAWTDPSRAEALVRHACDAQRDSEEPIGRLKSLTDRLRQRQRQTAVRTPGCDVARVVRATALILEGSIRSRATLHVVLEGSPVAPIDPAQLGQILVQLVTNALDALVGQAREHASVRILVRETEHEAIVGVSDSGPGVPPQLIERVFDPFFSTREDAHGVGLAVARQLAEQAGGSLASEARDGRGATFVLRLPKIATAG